MPLTESLRECLVLPVIAALQDKPNIDFVGDFQRSRVQPISG